MTKAVLSQVFTQPRGVEAPNPHSMKTIGTAQAKPSTGAVRIPKLKHRPPFGASTTHKRLSRVRRDIQNPMSEQQVRANEQREFADALVDQSDQRLSASINQMQIKKQIELHANGQITRTEHRVAIPAHSTFGVAWHQLHDALEAEPFKSFAQAKSIDVSSAYLHPSRGELGVRTVNGLKYLKLDTDPDWRAASGAVLAAAARLDGMSFPTFNRNEASGHQVVRFYGSHLEDDRETALFNIGALEYNANFESLLIDDPRYAAIKQKQRDAKQQIAGLPAESLALIATSQIPPTTRQRVEEADRELARFTGQASILLLPQARDDGDTLPIEVCNLPDYSTYYQLRLKLRQALDSEPFAAFARAHQLDISSVRIHPDSGELTGNINGKPGSFRLNDLSGWFDTWLLVKDAVQAFAAGSDIEVRYPPPSAPTLDDIQKFYGEKSPDPASVLAVLRYGNGLIDGGFAALSDRAPATEQAQAVQKLQQAVIASLDAEKVSSATSLTPLERLASRIKAHASQEAHQPDAPPLDVTAAADSALAVKVHQALSRGEHDTSVTLPAHSTAGRWHEQFKSALYSPAFEAFLVENKLDPHSVEFHPASNTFRAIAEHKPFEINFNDGADHPAILGLSMTAANILDSGGGRALLYKDADGDALPLSTVLNFYAVDRNDASAVSALGRDKAFAQREPVALIKSERARGIRPLMTHERLVGDIYDRKALNDQLQNLENRWGPPRDIHSMPAELDSLKMPIRAGSSYSQTHHGHAGTSVSVAQFIQASGRPMPQNYADVTALRQDWLRNPQVLLEEAVLAERYSRVLETQVAQATPEKIQVPAHSVMGAWYALYRAHFAQPCVANWIREQGITPATVMVTPSTGAMSARVNGEIRHFSLDDSSGWRRISSPIIAAAGVIAPGAGTALEWPTGAAGREEIAAFYGEETDAGASQIHARVAQLRAQGGFDLPAPASAPSLISRSVQSLQRHEQIAAGYYASINKADAAKARTEHEMTRYLHLLRTTGQALPVVRNEAKKWAEKIILEQTGRTVDADTIYLNSFKDAVSQPQTATGWEHVAEEPSTSLRLPDALLKNFSEKDRLPGELDLNAGLYTVGKGHGKEGYGAHNEFPLAPSALMKASLKTDFQAQFSTLLDDFWQNHADDYRTTLKGEFVRQARQQLKAYENASPEDQQKIPVAHRLTPADYQRIIAAVASNLPLDENQPLTVEQLRYRAPVNTAQAHVHPLVINGSMSSDILRISHASSNMHVLYIPAHQPAFLRFTSIDELDQWIGTQGKDPEKRKTLASHFRLKDRQDDEDFWTDVGKFFRGAQGTGAGVDTALGNIGSGWWSNGEGVIIDDQIKTVKGDLFTAMAGVASERMDDDADTAIKSNSEVDRDTWLNDMTAAAGLLAKFAPVGEPIVVGLAAGTGIAQLALGTEKAVSGDTAAERQQGVSGAVEGAMNTLFAVTSIGAEVVEDPFAVPAGPVSKVPDITSPSPRSLALRTETFADGTRRLTTENPLSEQAYTLPSANGFDVIDEERVYRYDPAKPGVLSDAQAVEGHRELQEFEAYCPAPSGRAKRGVSDTCFVRQVTELEGELSQELQALEHTRLYPSRAKLFNRDRFTLFEKRLYKVVDDKLLSMPNAAPVSYKHRIQATLINEKNFGLYGGATHPFLEAETRVVKLGPISDQCADSRDVRGVVVPSPIKGDATQYLVVEADIGEFYYEKLDNLKKANASLLKVAPNRFDRALARSYRNKLYLRQRPAGTAIDNAFITLPKLESVYKDLEQTGYSKADISKLKDRCHDMTAEQKREVAYQLQQRGATSKPHFALQPADVGALVQPNDFNSLDENLQNAFYARQAMRRVQDDMQATGLGPGNVVRSAADRARADAASNVVNWLRETRNPHALVSGKSIIKAGAGNCGEMAALSREIINNSGGRAYDWFAGDAHAFTVVGGPTIKPGGSVDFSTPQWTNAWIVDPWMGLACPASEYTQKVEQTMKKWAADGWTISSGADTTMSPLDPQWLDALVREPKEPYSHAYPRKSQARPVAEPRMTIAHTPSGEQRIFVPMGFADTVEDQSSVISTRSLTDCSGLAVLTDLKDGVYQKRTLMHLTASDLEKPLNGRSAYELLERLDKSLTNGGKAIFVGGIDSQRPTGMSLILKQEHNGKKPLLDMLTKPGVEAVIAGASGIDINPDGTFILTQDRGKGVFDQAAIKEVFDLID